MSTHSHEEDREDYAVCDDEDDGLDNEGNLSCTFCLFINSLLNNFRYHS